MRSVFVASLGHSGSTLLTLLLGAHSRLLGLGEVSSLFSVLDEGRVPVDDPCSCGSDLGDCPMWGPILGALAATSSPVERYALMGEHVAATFGPDVAIVDSSKNVVALRSISGVPGIELSVVHLVRDVRSWTVAFRERSRRKGDFGWRSLVGSYGVRGVGRAAWRSPFGCFRLWHLTNRDIEAALSQMRTPSVTVSYETLAFSPRRVLGALLDVLDLPFEDAVLAPDPAVNHVLYGNRMSAQPEKVAAIAYDTRWLTRRSWVLPSLVLRGVMAHNSRLVYEDSGDSLWTR